MMRLIGTSRFRFAAVVSVAALAGCKKPDPAETLSSVSSELATASIAAEAWVLHRTPNPFTRNQLRDARMSVAQQQKTLFTEAVPPVDTAKLRVTLDHSKNVLATLEQLIAKQDAKSFPSVLAMLEQDSKDVKDMSDSLDSSK